jgi:RNA recognition motif-containing protein
MNIYVGNLSYSVTEDELRQTFSAYGQVTAANVIKDRDSGQSKGFGFVEMASSEEAQAAIAALNGKELKGRAMTVNEARPRADRGSDRGGGGGGRMGGGRDSRGGGGGGGRGRY